MIETSENSVDDGSAIVGRHSIRADGTLGMGLDLDQTFSKSPSEKYPSLTNEGEAEARKTALREYVPFLEQAAPGSILVIAGASEAARTKATAEIMGDVLGDHFANSADVLVVRRTDIQAMVDKAIGSPDLSMMEKVKRAGLVVNMLRALAKNNPDKKIVITFPLYMKELSLTPHQRNWKDQQHTPFMKELIERTKGQSEADVIDTWFGDAENDPRVPSAQQTAETHIKAINRLRSTGKRLFGDRPILTGLVAHGWQLDALTTYLANKGVANQEAFRSVLNQQVMDQAETAKLTMTSEGPTFSYKDKEYPVPAEILQHAA